MLTWVIAALAALLLCAPASAQEQFVSGGPGFWHGAVLWADAGRPDSTTRPVRVFAIDRRGRRRTLLSLPPRRGGFTNRVEHFGATGRLIAVQRELARPSRRGTRYRELWVHDGLRWRRRPPASPLEGALDLDGSRLALVRDAVEVIDLGGGSVRLHVEGIVPRVRLAGDYLAVRRQVSDTPESGRWVDEVAIYAWRSGRVLYRVSIPALFGTSTTPSPSNFEFTTFDVNAAGTVVIAATDPLGLYPSGIYRATTGDPTPRKLPLPAVRNPVLLGGLLGTTLDGRLAVTDLDGAIVRRTRARGRAGFTRTEYAWHTHSLVRGATFHRAEFRPRLPR